MPLNWRVFLCVCVCQCKRQPSICPSSLFFARERTWTPVTANEKATRFSNMGSVRLPLAVAVKNRSIKTGWKLWSFLLLWTNETQLCHDLLPAVTLESVLVGMWSLKNCLIFSTVWLVYFGKRLEAISEWTASEGMLHQYGVLKNRCLTAGNT